MRSTREGEKDLNNNNINKENLKSGSEIAEVHELAIILHKSNICIKTWNKYHTKRKRYERETSILFNKNKSQYIIRLLIAIFLK